MYDSWDMEHNRHNFLSFWASFCPFTSQTTWKTKILKEWIKDLEISSFTHVYQKSQSYSVWLLRYKAQQTEFFINLGHFLPFNPPNSQKIRILKKWKKTSGDIIILHLRTTYNNHKMYSSWNMEHDRHNFCHFRHFLSFYSPQAGKSKFWKNEKNKHLEILSIYTCVP